MTRKDKENSIRVYLITRGGCASVDEAKTVEEHKVALAAMFKGAEGYRVERFMRDLMEAPEADDLYCQHMNQIRLPEGTWSTGRVVLLGDAAYCPTPMTTGVGTTAAIIGAYILAGETSKVYRENDQLPTIFSIKAAFQGYERVMRPYIMDKQSSTFWLTEFLLPRTKIATWIIHTIAGLVTALRIDRLLLNLTVSEESKKLEYPNYFSLEPGG